MDNDRMKKCPYCGETIREEAIKCRYCGTMLEDMRGFGNSHHHHHEKQSFWHDRGNHWRRVDRDKKIAGVCTGIAEQLDSPMLILPLRIFFIITTIFFGYGILIYLLLWILMPAPVDDMNYNSSDNQSPERNNRPGSGPPVVDHYPGQKGPQQRDEPVNNVQENKQAGTGTNSVDVDEKPVDINNKDGGDNNDQSTDNKDDDSRYAPPGM